MALPTLPEQPIIDPAGDYSRAQSFAILQANYEYAGNMAIWASNVLGSANDAIEQALSSDTVGPELTNLLSLLSDVPALNLSGITAYVAPDAPTYTAVPGYVAPTQGALTAIPDIPDVVVPDAPSSTLTYTNASFTDDLITALKSRLLADIAGVEAAEAAMFARHEGRVTAERAKAYTELTTLYSSAGWEQPPGALQAKQTEVNNETSKRLTDVSADIMMAAVKESLQGALQAVDLLARVHDSKQVRDFEKAKAEVQFSIEGFKATIEGLLGEIQISKTKVDAVVAANDGTIKAFLGQIEGQTAPMKAIADSNKAQAEAYKAAVDGAGAAVNASAIPEELKLKAMGVQGDIAGKAASLSVEAAVREVTLRVEAMRGLAQAAQQVIASAMGTMSTSSSFGWSGSASTSYDGDITDKIGAGIYD